MHEVASGVARKGRKEGKKERGTERKENGVEWMLVVMMERKMATSHGWHMQKQ